MSTGCATQLLYEPAESGTGLIGGNSNWRGPIWFPINHLLIEALRDFHRYYGDDFTVEHPTGSGQFCTLHEIADDLSRRLASIFLRDEKRSNDRSSAADPAHRHDPILQDSILSTSTSTATPAQGVGASHQTGWTALVAALLATS